MICSLCLSEIEDENFVIVDGHVRHISCSEEFEKMIVDLEKIYDDTCEKDI